MSNPYQSHDPRMNRVSLQVGSEAKHQEGSLMQWQTYEVFQQQKRGDQHVHVGSLHAPNPDMALILAKEQFGRREQCANLWVVKSQDVHATSYDDADMFQHAFDKSYREGDGYKVKDTIETFKRQLDDLLGSRDKAPGEVAVAVPVTSQGGWKVYELPATDKGERKILVKK
ncbi:MAG: 1,2-phenylacetyl-CoA epoxidase subunit PaaB [Bacteroidota bacterium]